jgi:hypothetical protein
VLGLPDRQLRVLDRYRPRRHADLAILFLLRQKWRTAVNRFAEAMTIFAVVCAGIFPGIHVGRVWFAWWLFPIPNQLDLAQLPQPAAVGRLRGLDLRDGLAAVLVHGHDPRPRDAARPGAPACVRASKGSSCAVVIAYGIFATRLAGGGRQPALAPLREGLPAARRALDAAGALGALGRVVRLRRPQSARLAHDDLPAVLRRGRDLRRLRDGAAAADPARAFFGLKDMLTLRHLENMAKIILLTGMMVGYAYGMEFFIAWYGGNEYERSPSSQPRQARARTGGPTGR